jgi:hypothetical protein
MSFLLFVGALLGIVSFALVVNRLTGTKAQYLEALALSAGENELWRDGAADYVPLPKLGRAKFMTFARRRLHTLVWTNHRLVVAQKPLFSSKHLITHQLFWKPREAAGEFFGGFYGRGFATVIVETFSFAHVGGSDCVRLEPTPASGEGLNIAEILVFTDRLAELRDRLPGTRD